jgi:2-methylcitrate dehydratase PrpD
MKPTETLARFITSTNFEDVPGDVVEKSKWAIADGLAVTFGGRQVIGSLVISFVESMGGNPESTVVGSECKTNPPLAAFANTTMSHVMDYDDINESMGGHPTGPVLGAVLALGEKLGASGKACLLAYMIGVEAETKIGRALIETLYVSGWHPTSVLGVMGSAAACGKLLGLNHEQMVMALGIAGSFAGGLKQNFGTLTKSLHVGQAAKNGVIAALLARDGWTSAPDILEGDVGYSNLFCGRGKFDLSLMTDHLGAPWDIADPGITLKKYPCCGSIHPALEAMLSLRDNANLAVDEVKELSCSVHPSKQHILVNPRPQTGLAAKFSIEYCMARAVIDDRISMTHFLDANVRDEVINGLLPRISILQDPEMPEWGSRVAVETVDGRTLSETCNELPGIDSYQDLAAKFNDCAAPIIGADRSKSVFEAIQRFDDIPNVADFAGTLL